MLASMSPVGELGRGQRWLVTLGAYVIGSVIGGLTAGALLGGVGAVVLAGVPDGIILTGFAMLAAAGLALETMVGDRGLPTWRRQVDERWLTRYRGWVYGLGFGLQLGTGVMTIVTSSVVYLTFAAALLTRSSIAGAAIGALFGLTRALPLAGTWRVRSPQMLADLHRRLHRRRRVTVRLAYGVQAVTAVAVGARAAVIVFGGGSWS